MVNQLCPSARFPAQALLLTLSCVACSGDPAAAKPNGSHISTIPMDGAAGAPAIVLEAAMPPSCASKNPPELGGTYTVPVSTDLDPYATFPVTNIEFCERTGVVTLAYDLPELLVGKSVKVSFRGAPDGGLVLSGSDGTASCAEASGSWSCQERLTGLTVNQAALEERLASLPAAEATGRRSVASVFGNDPIGVLSFLAR